MAKDEAKLAAAAAAASARSRSKKNKGQNRYYIAGGLFGASTLFAIWLGLTNDAPRGGKQSSGGASMDHALVNDASFIKGVTSDARGNFTAAASPFFNKWTYADLKYGLDGVGLHGANMVGMPGALQRCESDENTEGGVVPLAYDFREAHPSCASEIYDAGNCSSSHAIAAATSLANRFCQADSEKYKGLKLSAQQVISCDKKSRGCNGGGVDSVWGYIQRRGLYPESCVPFAGDKQTACKTDCKEDQKLKALSHCLLGGDEKEMKREIFNRGPVVAPIYIQDDFLVYEGGVYTPTRYSRAQSGADGNSMFAAVTVLGWGKADGAKYWIISQSWGTSWGEKGYARVAIDSIVREGYAIVGTPATEEALAEEQRKAEEAAIRLEEAKKERAARDERIAETRRQREEEEAAARDAADLTDLDSDDLDDDIEDLDAEEPAADGADGEEKDDM